MTDRAIDISPEQQALVANILRTHVPDREVWAFGSRVKGTARRYSDLDLVVIGESPLSLSQSASINEAFSESDLPWKVDVVDWATTDARFRHIIERDRVLLQNAVPGDLVAAGTVG